MNITAIAFTDRGLNLSKKLQNKSDGKITSFFSNDSNLSAWIEKNYSLLDALIFISNTETAIKVLAPYLIIKEKTPSVIIMDELGKFVIPLVSGTSGIANELASAIASFTESIPIITTDKETDNDFSVDKWANSIGLRIANPENIKYISSKMNSGEVVHFDSIFPILGEPPKGIVLSGPGEVSDFSITYLSSVSEKTLHLVPPVLTLGIICSSEAGFDEIETAYNQFLDECGCHPLSVRDVCSLPDNNANGLTEFCKRNDLTLKLINSNELKITDDKNTSAGVSEQSPNNDKVCEQCAISGNDGALFVRSMQFGSISMALAIKEPEISD